MREACHAQAFKPSYTPLEQKQVRLPTHKRQRARGECVALATASGLPALPFLHHSLSKPRD